MRKSLILIVLYCQIAFADDRKWTAMPFRLGGIGGLPQERDICLRVTINSERGELGYGPILLWRGKEDDQILQITNSLSALSKAVRIVIAGRSERDQRIVIKNSVGNYCRTIRAVLLVGEERSRALAEIARLDSGKSAELAKIAPDFLEQWERDAWQLSFYMLSEDGAVERHTFRGKRAPFVISQHETELVAEDGTMPWGRSRGIKHTLPEK